VNEKSQGSKGQRVYSEEKKRRSSLGNTKELKDS
jgi:hypothetical protein